ncbi:MAG TPA: branched-chain amino acid ABC transporter permease [Candidatus Dormibacteraeota bacterium]
MTRPTAWGAGRAVVIFGVLALLPFAFPAAWLVDLGFFGLMYAGLAVAWNLIGGYTGYIWLGLIGFFGFGAYALTITFQHTSVVSFWAPVGALIPIGIAAAIVAVPIGLVLMRVRGATFAVVSLSVLFIAEICASNWTAITNGAAGMPAPAPSIAAANFNRPFYLVMLALVALAMLISWYMRRSRIGLMLFAIRGDEERARGLGVPTLPVKLIAFAASCALAAMIGAVWAYYIGFIYPIFSFSPNTTFAVVMMVYLGGRGTLWGPLAGGLLVAPVQEYLAYTFGNAQFYLIGYAALFLIVIRFLPLGIVPSIHQAWLRRRSGEATPAPGTLPAT